MNSYITPNEFAGISMFDDEHSLSEKATTAVQQIIVINHTVSLHNYN